MRIEDITVNWGGGGGSGYAEYAGMLHSDPGPAESATQRASGLAEENTRKQQALMDSDLSSIEDGKSVQDTDMYKRTLGQATEDTSTAYDSVRAKRSAAARMAGFGYEQPATQGDQTSVDAMEAHDVGDLPRSVANDVEGMRQQAASMRGSMAATYQGANSQDLGTWNNAEQQRQARQAAMWSKIAGLGVTAATEFVPH